MQSIAAKMVLSVYDHFNDSNVMPKIKGWTLVAISNTAAVFKNDKLKSYAYAFRGMMTPEDALSIPSLVNNTFSSTARYIKDKAFVQEHPAPKAYNRYGFGHSLGGAVVDQLLADGLVYSAYTFNPAIELNKMHNRSNIRIYKRNDFLYKLIGQYASNVKTVDNDLFSRLSATLNFFNVAKSIYEHNIRRFVPESESESESDTEKQNTTVGQMADPKSYVIQSVILHKSAFPTLESAKEWAALHKYRVNKHDETLNEWRFRQINPEIFHNGHYEPKTIKLAKVGYLIVGYKM